MGTVTGSVTTVAYILYYIGPLIESVNPRFVNIRKLCLAVYLEVSTHKDRNGEVTIDSSSHV